MQDDETLDVSQATAQLKALAKLFADAWSGEQRPRLEEFLQQAPEGHRAVLFRDLLVIECEQRRKRQERIGVEEYRERFPDRGAEVTEVLSFASATEALKPAQGSQPLSSPSGVLPGSSLPGSLQLGAQWQLKPGAVLGAYEIVAVLGQGGMGKVYKARQTETQLEVALKVMSLDATKNVAAVKRFQREAKAAVRLQHPNIVGAHDAGEVDGRPYLALELVDGPDLSMLVKNDGPLPISLAVDYIRQAAEGLAYAHSRGVIHRDIKPSNLMLDRASGQIKVLDLGLARVEASLEEATQASELTSTGAAFGTLDYMAPEQARDAKRANARSDIYSLGCSLYYLLMQRVLYESDSLVHKIRQHASGEIPNLAELRDGVPHLLARVFRRMVAKQPEHRYASMDEVVGALHEVSEVLAGTRPDSEPVSADSFENRPETRLEITTAPRPQSKPAEAARRRFLPMAVALVVVVALSTALLQIPGKNAPETTTPGMTQEGDSDGNSEQTADSGDAGDKNSMADVAPEEPAVAAIPVWQWPAGWPRPLIAPVERATAKSLQAEWATKLDVPLQSSNSIELPLVLVPPGEFDQGAPGDVFGLSGDKVFGMNEIDAARPVRRVRLTRPFQIGATEVTVGQFQRFVQATGYKTTAELSGKGGWLVDDTAVEQQATDWIWSQPKRTEVDPNEPVRLVTRTDADAFCAWLSQQEKVTYRLPTEAEWEFACRAGSGLSFGVVDHVSELEAYAWAEEGRTVMTPLRRLIPHAVGQKQANDFGLHDMLGNVWELTGEGFQPRAYQRTPELELLVNPVVPSDLQTTIRGGSSFEGRATCNPAIRMGTDRPTGHIGFRVVKELPPISELEPPLVATLPKAGAPLSPRATVAVPPQLSGVLSWSIETIGIRDAVNAIDYSPQAKLVAVGGTNTDPLIRLYDEKLNFRHFLAGIGSDVSSLAFSPDGQYLAALSWAGNWDNGLRVWHVPTRRLALHQPAGLWLAPAVVWSPDSRRVAYATPTLMRIVELRTGISSVCAVDQATGMTWSPDGTRLAIRDGKGKLRIHAAPALNVLAEVPVVTKGNALRWSPNGKVLAVVGEPQQVQLLDGENYSPLKTLKATDSISQFLWTPDSKQLVVTGSQAAIGDVESNTPMKTFSGKGLAVWIKPGESLVFGRPDGQLDLRSLTGLPQGRLRDPGRPRAGWTVLSPTGREIVCRVDKSLHFFDAETGESRGSQKTLYDTPTPLEWSPDGQRLVFWKGKEFVISSRETGEKLATGTGHAGDIMSVAWSPDGQRLVTSSADMSMRIWEASSGKPLAQQTFTGPTLDAVWSRSGEILAVALAQEVVLLDGNGQSIKSQHAFAERFARVYGAHGLAFSHDDRWLASGHGYAQVGLVDLAMGLTYQNGVPSSYEPYVGHNSWSKGDRWLMTGDVYLRALVNDLSNGKRVSFFPFVLGQWHPDGRRLLSGVANHNFEIYGYDIDHQQRTGVLVPATTSTAAPSLCVGATGHLRGSASAVGYVALLETGEQRTFTQAAFEKRFGWKNDSTQASLMKLTTPQIPDPVPQQAFESLELLKPLVEVDESKLEPSADLQTQRSLGARSFVARPEALPQVATWTVETAVHRGNVMAVAYAPHGKVIATAGDDGTLRLWDENCRLIAVLVGAGGPVRLLEWSRSARYLASAGDDRIVRIWDAVERRLLREISVPVTLRHLAWSPDASRIAAPIVNGCWMIDVRAGQSEELVFVADNSIYWPSWSPDGRHLALSRSGVIQILDTQSWSVLREIPAPTGSAGFSVVGWAPRGDELLAIHNGGTQLGAWDPKTGQHRGEVTTPVRYAMQALRFSSAGSRLVMGGGARHVIDVEQRRVFGSLPNALSQVADISPDGQRVAGINAGRLVVHEFLSGKELATLAAQGVYGNAVTAVPTQDGRAIHALLENAEALSFDGESGRLLKRTVVQGYWQAVGSGPDKDLIVVKTNPSAVGMLSLNDGKVRRFDDPHEGMQAVAWSDDGQRLATVGAKASLKLWDVDQSKASETYTLPQPVDRDVVWKSNNEVQARSLSGIVQRVDVVTGKVLERTYEPKSRQPDVRQETSTKDGKWIVRVEAGGAIRVWAPSVNRSLGTVLVGLPSGGHVVIGPTGHVKASPFAESLLVYVTLDEQGRQTSHTPARFRAAFGWNNDSSRAVLASLKDEPEATPLKPAAPTGQNQLAARKIIELGGWLHARVGGQAAALRKFEDIPGGEWDVIEVFWNDKPVTDADLSVLKDSPWLRRLELNGCQKLTDAALAGLGTLPQLRDLYLGNTNITAEGLVLTGFPQLQTLWLHRTNLTADAGARLKVARKLKSLTLSGSGAAAKIFADLPDLPQLQWVNLNGLVLDDEAIEHLSRVPNLRDIALINSGKFTTRSGAAYSKMRALQSLILHGEAAADEVIEGFTVESSLQRLVLQGAVTDRAARALGKVTALRELTLNGPAITDEGLKAILALPLSKLVLDGAKGVTGTGFEATPATTALTTLRMVNGATTAEGLSQLSKLRALRTLEVDGRALDARSLTALVTLPQLEQLTCYDLSKLKPDDLASLEQAPKLNLWHITQADLTPEHWAFLKRLPKLNRLVLENSTLKRLDLEDFKAARPRVTLEVRGGQVQ